MKRYYSNNESNEPLLTISKSRERAKQRHRSRRQRWVQWGWIVAFLVLIVGAYLAAFLIPFAPWGKHTSLNETIADLEQIVHLNHPNDQARRSLSNFPQFLEQQMGNEDAYITSNAYYLNNHLLELQDLCNVDDTLNAHAQHNHILTYNAALEKWQSAELLVSGGSVVDGSLSEQDLAPSHHKNVPGGVAGLDESGLLFSEHLPPIYTDNGTSLVTSINSQTGNVVLDTDNVLQGTTNKYLLPNSVTQIHIINDSVGTGELLDGAVTGPKLALGAVIGGVGGIIADGTIVGADMASNTLSGTHLTDNSIAQTHISANSVSSSQLQNSAVQNSHIADGSVSASKMAASSVTGGVNGIIADNSITHYDVAPNTLTGAEMAPASIGTTELVDSSVTTIKLADGSVEQSKLSTDSVGTLAIIDGSVTGPKISPGSVGDTQLAASHQRAVPLGVAPLAADGKVPVSYMHAIGVQVDVCANITCRDALVPAEGDVCKVTDTGSGDPGTFIYDGSAWVVFQESSTVLSVNSQTGNVVLDSDDVSEGTTNKYLLDSSVSTVKLLPSAVTTDKIADSSVTGPKIATNAVGSSAIIAESVGSIHIATGAVGTDELGSGVVTAAKLGTSSVSSMNVIDNTLVEDDMSPSYKKNVANGIAGLDSGGMISDALLPIKNKFDATVPPTINEDSGDGYAEGSVWIDLSADRCYTLVDSTVGAAVWQETSNDASVKSSSGSSTDNAVARFDSTSGLLIQNSLVTIDDSGNIATAGTVDGRDVSADGSLLDSHVADTSNPHSVSKAQVIGTGSIVTADLASSAVTEDKIANSAITTNKVADSSLTTAKVANSAITTDKVADFSITSDKLGAGSVTGPKISPGSVGDTQLASTHQRSVANGIAPLAADGKVPIAFLHPFGNQVDVCADITCRDALTPNEGDICKVVDTGSGQPGTFIYDGSAWVTFEDSSNVQSVNSQTGNVVLDSDDIAEGATNKYLTDGSVTEPKLGTAVVTTDKLASSSVTGPKIASGAVGSGALATGSVGTSHFSAGAVDSAALGSLAVVESKIATSAVTSDKLASNSVTGSAISSGAVGTTQLADSSVTPVKLSSVSVNDLTDVDTTSQAPTSADSLFWSGSAWVPLKHNFAAATAPTANDDSSFGKDYAVGSRWMDLTNDKEYVCLSAAVGASLWIETTQQDTGGGGGEVNDATNIGTAGVGVYKQKTGLNLELKKINAGSAKITVTDDTGNNEIDIDLASNSVDTTELVDSAVTLAKLASDSVDSSKILADTIVEADMSSAYKLGVANGLATLNSLGKVHASQLDLDSVDYQGTWNAATNTPTLTSSSCTKGQYYVVSVAGTTNLDGITDWQVSDWCICSSTNVWEKADHSDAVHTVAGKNGDVTLEAADILSGTWADTFITESSVTQHEAALNIVTANLAAGAVTADKVATDTLTATEIGPNAVGSSELADNSVDEASIINGAVSGSKIAAGAVGPSALGTIPIDTLSDVDTTTTTPTASDSLRWTGSSWVPLKHNVGATVPPTVTDDTTAGYEVGSRWIDTDNNAEHVCVDATASSAQWVETTGAAAGSGGDVIVQDEGSAVSGGPFDTLNFVGPGVTVTNGGGGTATVTISGGGGSTTYQEITAAAVTSTTSSTYSVISGMTVTPASGTYHVTFSASGNTASGGADASYSIYGGGAMVGHSRRSFAWNGGAHVADYEAALSTQAVVTVNGAQAIEIRFATTSSTFTVNERSMFLWKVA